MTRHRPAIHALLLVAAAATPLACQSTTPSATRLEDGALILFVGNSLTYSNDLPSLVREEAAARGRDVHTHMIAHPNFSLEDHWGLGIDDSIRAIAPDVVLMQQGPSSLPESRANLIQWTDSLARATRAAGAEPVLLMVWPPLDREFAWDDVTASYEAAADAVDARVVPAGERLRAALEHDPSAPLLSADGFHPALEGSRLVARAIVDELIGD